MVDIEAAIELHNQLNPKIWSEDNKLLPEVRAQLIEIVEEFASTIEVPLVIVDAHIVGSNASYNYNDQSDLDLHCIVNFARLDADPAIIESWMWAEKKLFNDDYDITINGINVEIYVEDIGANTMSNGIYSLLDDEWIKFPEPISVTIDQGAVDNQVQSLIPEVDEALNSNDLEAVLDCIDDLYLMRKKSLASEGEYGIGNLAFKELRNMGYLDRLKEAATNLRSKELSM